MAKLAARAKKNEMDEQLARQASIRTVLGIAAVKHRRVAKRALQYLWPTKDLGISYGGTPGSCTKLSAWAGTNFATCPDSRRLVSGGTVMLGGGGDQLVLEGTESDRGCAIRIRVCDAGRSCK